MEMYGELTTSPAAGDVNRTSANAVAQSAARSKTRIVASIASVMDRVVSGLGTYVMIGIEFLGCSGC